MKILRDEIKEYAKLLKDFNYPNLEEATVLFFPIDGDESMEDDNTLILTEVRQRGCNAFVQPGLFIRNNQVYFGFAHVEYEFKLKLREFVDMFKDHLTNMSKEELEKIMDKEALLVNKVNILASFEY